MGGNVPIPEVVQEQQPSARFAGAVDSNQVPASYDMSAGAISSAEPVGVGAKETIAQNHAVNDAFIDNIRAKLDMLDQI